MNMNLRMILWAAQAGLPAEGIGSKTAWWFWLNAFMRECAGLVQYRWKQELVLLVCLMLLFGLLSMTIIGWLYKLCRRSI